jgi:hypothetical protein
MLFAKASPESAREFCNCIFNQEPEAEKSLIKTARNPESFSS